MIVEHAIWFATKAEFDVVREWACVFLAACVCAEMELVEMILKSVRGSAVFQTKSISLHPKKSNNNNNNEI